MQASDLYPALWILQHGIKTSNGLPFEFKNHLFMVDIINDRSQFQVGLKPPQIGWSESLIVKSFYIADKDGVDIIYTLPTATDRDDMVNSKVNRIIAQNPILQKMVKDHDTVEQKSVGGHLIHYRGTFAVKQAMMVSSELNIHDEVDASDPAVITQYETRQQAVSDARRWYFSHPSLAGHGVDIYWQQSDKREWHIICPHCHVEQILTWPDNIDISRRAYVCVRCRAELPDGVRRTGTWKPTSVGPFRGYHVSQLMCAWITAGKIIDAYNDPMKDKQYFYNYVLGLPYIGSEDKIDPKVVLKNCVDEVNDQKQNIMIGLDTGLPIHYTLMNQDGVFFFGTCEPETEHEKYLQSVGKYDPYDKVRFFLDKWKHARVVSDQGGDLIGIRKLQQEYPGRVFLCYYRKDKKGAEVVKWGKDNEHGVVTVDRNRMIQLIVEQLRDQGRIRINGLPEEWTEWAEHFGNIYREKVIVKDTPDKDDRSLYGNEYIWKRKGPDHYVHTLLYAMVGLDRYGQSMAKITGTDPLEGIPMGQIVDTMNPMDPKSYRPAQVVGLSPSDFTGQQVEL